MPGAPMGEAALGWVMGAALSVALPTWLAARAARRWPQGLALLDPRGRCRWRNGAWPGAAPPGPGAPAALGPWGGWRLVLPPAPAAAEEAPLRGLLESAPVGLWQLDGAGHTVFANQRLRALFGGAAPPALAGSGLALVGQPAGEGPLGLPLGQEREAVLARAGAPALRLVVVATAARGAGHLLALLDVTPFKAAQERIEHLAEHDSLTGLANRATLRAGLDAMSDDPAGGVVVRLDLDHWRAVNGRHGHAAGDALLREAARRLRGALRPADLVSRLEGEEFAVLVFGGRQEDADRLGARLRDALHAPFRLDGLELPLSASIGLALAPDHGEDAESLLRAANLAALAARAQGRGGQAVFDPALLERAERRARTREAFVAALAADELELHIQPQRDLRCGRLVGGEALIRWNSRALGRWVPPDEILAAAGEAGLLRDLDRFVLRRAAQLQASWQGQPGALAHLSINISSVTLHDPAFAQEVAEMLAAHGLPPGALEIEIPEDLAVRDLPAVARTMAAMHEAGVQLALDDFGAGHSNLTHVVNLPVQRIKLDRSNVARLPDDPKAYAILRSVMAMARGMGIEVVAEGVETEPQAEALARLGCHVIQGWLVAKAMPPEALRRGFDAPAPRQATG